MMNANMIDVINQSFRHDLLGLPPPPPNSSIGPAVPLLSNVTSGGGGETNTSSVILFINKVSPKIMLSCVTFIVFLYIVNMFTEWAFLQKVIWFLLFVFIGLFAITESTYFPLSTRLIISSLLLFLLRSPIFYPRSRKRALVSIVFAACILSTYWLVSSRTLDPFLFSKNDTMQTIGVAFLFLLPSIVYFSVSND